MTEDRMICLFPTDSTCRDNGLSTQQAGATGRRAGRSVQDGRVEHKKG